MLDLPMPRQSKAMQQNDVSSEELLASNDCRRLDMGVLPGEMKSTVGTLGPDGQRPQRSKCMTAPSGLVSVSGFGCVECVCVVGPAVPTMMGLD